MAFKHHISFATDLAANFGCNRFRIMPDIVSKLLRPAIWSWCALRVESEQTPFPRTGRRFSTCCFAQDSIQNILFCFYVIFLIRDQCLIERLSEAMGAALVGNNFSPLPQNRADCSRNLQIENRSSSCQRWSLHAFQTSHFICNRFGCKLWLQLIQNHARHHFHAFEPTIWSWCAVRVESEQTPFPLSCLFRPAALHRIQFGTCGFVSMSYFSRYFATCNQFFCVQDCHSRIVQVEYQGQTRSTRILERKPLINTSYHIRHRLELKYFHLAQFFLNAHRAAHPPRKSENW